MTNELKQTWLLKKTKLSFLEQSRMATEIPQVSNATQQILVSSVDNAKYCFPFTLVFWIVTFSLVFKIPHLEKSLFYDILRVALWQQWDNWCVSPTQSGQSTLGHVISSVFTCRLWAEPPEICHDINHSLCGFCRWRFFSCLKQLFFTPASVLSLTAYSPIFCSKCEVFEVGNLFLNCFTNQTIIFDSIKCFWSQMHWNTSGCRHFILNELWAAMIF